MVFALAIWGTVLHRPPADLTNHWHAARLGLLRPEGMPIVHLSSGVRARIALPRKVAFIFIALWRHCVMASRASLFDTGRNRWAGAPRSDTPQQGIHACFDQAVRNDLTP